MENLNGKSLRCYDIGGLLAEGSDSVAYRAIRFGDNTPVAIVIPRLELTRRRFADPEDLTDEERRIYARFDAQSRVHLDLQAQLEAEGKEGPVPIFEYVGFNQNLDYEGSFGPGKQKIRDRAPERQKQSSFLDSISAQEIAEFASSGLTGLISLAQSHEQPGPRMYRVMACAGNSLRREIEIGGAHTTKGQQVNRFLEILSFYEEVLPYLPGKAHGDLTPGNILWYNRKWRINDFPAGSTVGIEDSCDPIDLRKYPAFGYIAPEFMTRNPPSANIRGDIYSLGATFSFMLTGEDPIGTSDAIRELRNTPFGRIIDKAMERNPNNRYSSVEEMRRDIETACDRYEGRHNTPFVPIEVDMLRVSDRKQGPENVYTFKRAGGRHPRPYKSL